MNELTKREQIALTMLQGHPDLVRCDYGVKLSFLTDAFTFADLFLSISEDRAGKSVSEMENTDVWKNDEN